MQNKNMHEMPSWMQCPFSDKESTDCKSNSVIFVLCLHGLYFKSNVYIPDIRFFYLKTSL